MIVHAAPMKVPTAPAILVTGSWARAVTPRSQLDDDPLDLADLEQQAQSAGVMSPWHC